MICLENECGLKHKILKEIDIYRVNQEQRFKYSPVNVHLKNTPPTNRIWRWSYWLLVGFSQEDYCEKLLVDILQIPLKITPM